MKILRITLAKETNLPQIETIIQDSYQEIAKKLSRPPGAIVDTGKKLMASHRQNQLFTVCKENETIIGTFSLTPTVCNTIKISHFAIKPEFQNQGVGTWVINEIEKKCSTEVQKYEAIDLEVYAKVPKLSKFYEKLGFSIIGEKEIKNEKIFILSKSLKIFR